MHSLRVAKMKSLQLQINLVTELVQNEKKQLSDGYVQKCSQKHHVHSVSVYHFSENIAHYEAK